MITLITYIILSYLIILGTLVNENITTRKRAIIFSVLFLFSPVILPIYIGITISK